MEEVIGRGGMGTVHRAYDTQHDRVVAVKLLADHAAGDEEFRRRFVREARAAARLREPHVIPIHAYGEIDGRLYLDMRLVEGKDLRAMLADRGPMPPSTAVDVISQIASALDAAHAEGLVHRDVKPSNVLLDSGGFAYLVDFGIARWLAATADITTTGMPIGTVAYMAPERFRTDGSVDHRVDVYALACLLFQCLTEVPPFHAENALALVHAHVHQAPPMPTALRPDLPPDFDRIIATGMAKSPEDRFPSAGALASAARQALTRPAPNRPPTLPIPHLGPASAAEPPAKAGGRGALIGGMAVIVAVLAAVAVLIWSQANRAGESGKQQISTSTPPGTAAPNADLSVSVPLSTPACDGSYVLIVGSAITPQQYQRTVQTFLDQYPGARYFHAPSTGCRSLRHQLDGADIYSIYYGPFPDKETACARRATTGGDSFVRRLDNSSTPERAVSCD
ncbi:MAG TPA: serine/threonine-protein kinase [Actinophytocola sp.]|uniref:serine/threonine-protein kinase n=1 Tax=Actinophytocola sp. TaxID=1872138 RepID=UPI002DBD8EB5|nr:serine/threonine-protein kinase [Actinophytocola sp.]HEU5474662.1 serine/threonine-protein kinase [Actinophytocola sp.]